MKIKIINKKQKKHVSFTKPVYTIIDSKVIKN